MSANENQMKEQEREELHRTIWSIANDLRGAIDKIVAELKGDRHG